MGWQSISLPLSWATYKWTPNISRLSQSNETAQNLIHTHTQMTWSKLLQHFLTHRQSWGLLQQESFAVHCKYSSAAAARYWCPWGENWQIEHRSAWYQGWWSPSRFSTLSRPIQIWGESPKLDTKEKYSRRCKLHRSLFHLSSHTKEVSQLVGGLKFDRLACLQTKRASCLDTGKSNTHAAELVKQQEKTKQTTRILPNAKRQTIPIKQPLTRPEDIARSLCLSNGQTMEIVISDDKLLPCFLAHHKRKLYILPELFLFAW